jgi:hypothetical protein
MFSICIYSSARVASVYIPFRCSQFVILPVALAQAPLHPTEPGYGIPYPVRGSYARSGRGTWPTGIKCDGWNGSWTTPPNLISAGKGLPLYSSGVKKVALSSGGRREIAIVCEEDREHVVLNDLDDQQQ